MQDTPKVSVIITAHDRTEFLPRALASLQAQTLPASQFDVAVVKNFRHRSSEKLCQELGATVIDTTTVPQGGKIALGLAVTTGPVISILEDDDVFAPSKLERVSALFAGPARPVYFHNGNWLLHSDGRTKASRSRSRRPKDEAAISRATNDRWRYQLGTIPRPYFNASSISIDREALSAHVGMLSEIHLILDVFLFFVALSTGGLLRFSEDPLTGVGIGSSNVSLGGEAPTRRAQLGRLQKYSEGILLSYEVVQQLAAETGNSEVALLLASAISLERGVGFLRGIHGTRAEFSKVAKALISNRDSPFVRQAWQAIPLVALGVLSPALARASYAVAGMGRPS